MVLEDVEEEMAVVEVMKLIMIRGFVSTCIAHATLWLVFSLFS